MAELTDLSGYLNRRLDRRKFLIGAAGAAATYSSITFLLSACATSSTTSSGVKKSIGAGSLDTGLTVMMLVG